MPWRLLHRPLQDTPHEGVLLGNHPREVAERAQHRLVRTQLIDGLDSHNFTHAVRQNPVPVGHRRNNPRNQTILEIEHRLGAEAALIGLGPKIRPGHRVYELHAQPQLSSGLPQIAFHHVARAQFSAGSADIARLIDVPGRRAACDHLEVGEA